MSISVNVQGAVGWITLDRPKAMNAISGELADRAVAALERWRIDAQVRVVVLTGNGPAFCAGADLKEGQARTEPGEPDQLDRLVAFFNALRSFPKPVIAAVNGIALAGGLELVMACDLVLAAQSARLGDAHANFGVFPGGGGAAVLPRRIPANVAKYLLFTGESMTAAELKHYGLVNEVVEDAQLIARVQELAEKLAQKSPLVLARMKRVANATTDKSQSDALRDELLELRDHQRSHDVQEGLRAFVEKRAPQFKGY